MTKIDKQREALGLTAIALIISKTPIDAPISTKAIVNAHSVLNEFQCFQYVKDFKSNRNRSVFVKRYPQHRWKTDKLCYRYHGNLKCPIN